MRRIIIWVLILILLIQICLIKLKRTMFSMMRNWNCKKMIQITFLIFNPINIYLQGRWLRMLFSELLFYHRSPQGFSMLFIALNCMIIFNQYWIFQSFKTLYKIRSYNLILQSLPKEVFPFFPSFVECDHIAWESRQPLYV